MNLWVVRAGRHGEQLQDALDLNVVCHGWEEVPDYSHCQTIEDLKKLYRSIHPDVTEMHLANQVGQLWRFAHKIQVGDLVALPRGKEGTFEFGRVTGPYQNGELSPSIRHWRSVKWLATIPKSAIPKDILFSMNSAMTIFGVERNNAAERIEELVKSYQSGKLDAGMMPPELADNEQEVDASFNYETAARDEILGLIQEKFKGHDFARLIEAILQAQGYKTKRSEPGPDSGVDILAGSGTLGFQSPRLCVQVKSGLSTEGQAVFNELLGVVSKFGSDQGLLVSWGGFTNPVLKDARKHFFQIRLWNQVDVLDALLQNYDRLDEDIRAEIPLKRIWTLVRDEDE